VIIIDSIPTKESETVEFKKSTSDFLKNEELEIPMFSQTGNYFGITFKRPLLDKTEEDLPKVTRKKILEDY